MEDTSYVVNQVPPMSLWRMEASRKRPTELRIRCWTGLSGQANFAAGMGLVAVWPEPREARVELPSGHSSSVFVVGI
jgi:hypothetical protein